MSFPTSRCSPPLLANPQAGAPELSGYNPALRVLRISIWQTTSNHGTKLWNESCIMNSVEISGAMWIVNLIPLFFILGLFLAMLSSSPKADR